MLMGWSVDVDMNVGLNVDVNVDGDGGCGWRGVVRWCVRGYVC